MTEIERYNDSIKRKVIVSMLTDLRAEREEQRETRAWIKAGGRKYYISQRAQRDYAVEQKKQRRGFLQGILAKLGLRRN